MAPDTSTRTLCAAALLAAATLLACAAPHPPAPLPPAVTAPAPVAPPPSPPPVTVILDSGVSPVSALLAQADRLRGLAGPDLAQEIARLGDGGGLPERQLQLALALLQTRVPADGQRAQALLQRVLAQDSAAARALHPLARQVAAQYTEQRRLEEQLERQAQQLRDGQRRIDQLNDRLQALRAIERSLPSRPTP